MIHLLYLSIAERLTDLPCMVYSEVRPVLGACLSRKLSAGSRAWLGALCAGAGVGGSLGLIMIPLLP